jgi:hypothetical protein
MIENLQQATNEINQMFLDFWNSETSLEVELGYMPSIRWYGNDEGYKPDASKFWIWHSTQSVFEEQATLNTCTGKPGEKRYNCAGLVIVQIFCPKSETNAKYKGAAIAQVCKNAYRGKHSPNKIWFRNVRILDISDETLYYRFNVIAEYEYDELF